MPPPKAKGGKMLGLIHWRLKVTLNDGRHLIGQMLAFDRHMNLVLADCEEFRRVRAKKANVGEDAAGAEQEMKRTLGLVILRGETVVSITVEGPPPVQDEDKKTGLLPGPGRGMPAARGMGPTPFMGGPPMGRPMQFGPPGMPGGPPPPGFGPPGFGGPPPGFPPPPGFGGPPPGFQPPPQ